MQTLKKVVKEPDNRFRWELCKIYKRLPSDDWFDEIDPIEMLWMYHSWIQDQEDRFDYARNHGILVGSFFNPEAAQHMAKADDHDFQTTDEEFEESWNMVLRDREKKIGKTEPANKPPMRRRRKIVKDSP